MAGQLTHIDLFAGCGGLSLGLEQAGFQLVLGVEKSPMAAETFYHNLIEPISDQSDWHYFASKERSVQEQALKKLVVKELSTVLACKDLLEHIRKQDIDLVAGGPPCQGFSLAGRRNPDDIRNELPWHFLEFVEAVEPKAVIIENVSGISQDFKKTGKASPLYHLRNALIETGAGYEVQPVLLNAMHFGVPQHRQRIMLLGIRKDISSTLGYTFNEQIWKSDFDQFENLLSPQRPDIAPRATHFEDDILTVADAIADLGHYCDSSVADITEYASEMRRGWSSMPAHILKSYTAHSLKNHMVRNHSEHVEARFRLYQYFRDEGVHPMVMSLPKRIKLPEVERKELILKALEYARIPAKSPDGNIIAKTKNELVNIIMSLGTKKHSQRALSWSLPSRTVVSLPDDHVHPDEPRTLTVREMARFQSFPDSFEFRSKETTGGVKRRIEVPQYTQVGNAVPPKMAKAVGQSIKAALETAFALQQRRVSMKQNDPALVKSA